MALIYIVEDDEGIREIEEVALKNSGHEIRTFDSAELFFKRLQDILPDLILLDVMLPDLDGNHIVKRLRENVETKKIPVIMVTAKTTEMDMVRGLENGADDYIKKPFSIIELITRVKAVLRRSEPKREENLVLDEIEIDDLRHQCTSFGRVVELTYKEHELLKYLIINKGRVLSRDQIMAAVWETDFEGESRTVDMHIKTLRQKLGESAEHIKTVRNVGYVIE